MNPGDSADKALENWTYCVLGYCCLLRQHLASICFSTSVYYHLCASESRRLVILNVALGRLEKERIDLDLKNREVSAV